MNISAPFIRRPVGTTLLTIGLALAGAIAFKLLPVSPLPPVDFPTISVSANLPGADPETMATSVAAPLERQFARIAGVTEITSTSNRGSTSITMQFDLSRDINGAARDVQGAINAARGYLPANLPSNPTYRKVNPADAPIMILSLTSNAVGTEKMYDAASTILAQKLSQVEGIGQVFVGGSSLPAVRVDLNPMALNRYGIGLDNVRRVLQATNANRPKGQLSDATRTWELTANDQIRTANQYMPLVIGVPERVGRAAFGRGRRAGFGGRPARGGAGQRQAGGARDPVPAAGSEHHRDGRPRPRPASAAGGFHAGGRQAGGRHGPVADDPRVAPGGREIAGHLGAARDPGGLRCFYGRSAPRSSRAWRWRCRSSARSG